MKNRFHFRHSFSFILGVAATVAIFSSPVLAQDTLAGDEVFEEEFKPTPTPTQKPVAIEDNEPPQAQAYVKVTPRVEVPGGRTMVPISFLSDALGASAGPVTQGRWKILYFGHNLEIFPNQYAAIFNGKTVQLPATPQNIKGTLYVPWTPLAELFGIKWNVVSTNGKSSTMLIQYPAAYIQNVRYSVQPDRTRVTIDLSNPTRIVASQNGLDVQFQLAGARRAGVPTVTPVGDYLVPRAVTQSGDWRAKVTVRMNYSAPVHWFTVGSPPRLVIDLQRLFEEKSTQPIGGGLKMTKIRKGTGHGPVQMYVVRVNPDEGWRLRIASGGYSVMQRNRPSRVARTKKALVAVNGGFFAYDGAAVGAVQVNGEWLRLPWKARTAVAFRPNGQAKIGNLQAQANAVFGSGLKIPVRDLNGWPDMGRVTALTVRFGTYYKLRPGEMAVVVRHGVVLAKPGGGNAPVHPGGFTLIGSGGARPYLDMVKRGERAKLSIYAPGWEGYTSALGGGPRLVNNGRIEVTALKEAFRSDVRIGTGPRTALGIDRSGNYILVVVDGRQKYHSTGLTLEELAATMQKLGAVDALNLDGGGSTALAVRGRVINKPSDGSERSVSNVLLVMR